MGPSDEELAPSGVSADLRALVMVTWLKDGGPSAVVLTCAEAKAKDMLKRVAKNKFAAGAQLLAVTPAGVEVLV